MGKEGDAAAVRARAEDPEVRFDELVEEPRAQEEPGREANGDHDDQAEHGRVGIEHEVRAEYRGDRAAGPEVRNPRIGCGAERKRRRTGRNGTCGRLTSKSAFCRESASDRLQIVDFIDVVRGAR